MKLKSNIFAKWAGIIAGCASVIACSDLSELEERVDDLDSRVTALETQVENLNTSIEAIQAIAEAGNVITGITENNGEYTITTSDGKTYTLKQGESGKTPQIGINEDGNWQVRYDNGDGTWTDWTVINVGDSDTPASAVAVVPQFRVNDEGNWEISTNGGVNFNPVYKEGTEDPVPATGDSGSDIFKSVTYSPEDGLLHIVMHDNTELDVLVVSDFGCSIWNEAGTEVIDYDTPVSVPVNTTVRFTVKTTNVTALDIEAPSGWETVMGDIDASGIATLEVTAPDKAESVELTKITSNSKRDVTIHATNKDGKSAFAKIQVRAVAGDIPEVTVTAAETQGFNSLTFSFADALHLTSYRHLLYKAGTMEPGESAFPASSEINIADASDIDDLEISKTADGAALEFGTDYVLYVLPVNTTSAGITTGNIIKVEASTDTPENYYELYEAGIDIIIGDVTVNKTTYGEAIEVTSANASITANKTGSTNGFAVYFVDAEANATFDVSAGANTMIIIGNDLNAKSPLKVNKRISLNQTTGTETSGIFLCHNLALDMTGFNNYHIYMTVNNSTYGYVGFVDCDINLSTYNLFGGFTTGRKLGHIEFDSCNFNVSDLSNQTVLINPASTTVDLGTISFRNNIVYSTAETGKTDFRILLGPNASVDKVIFKNNSFINIWHSSGAAIAAFFGYKSLSKVEIENNIIWADKAFTNNLSVFRHNTAEGSHPDGDICRNNIIYSPNITANNIWMFFNNINTVIDNGFTDAQEIRRITDDPYAGGTFNLKNGVFVPNSTYSSYGATR